MATAQQPARPRPVVLVICDGWGVAPDSDGNAITRAQLPNFNKWIREYPVMTIVASSTEVGLSWGEMGNSEVGHLNIGAGRVYYQTFPRINKEIASKEFFQNEAFKKAVEQVKKNNSKLHLIGILSPGNVHGSEEHCWSLLELAKQQGVTNVFVHAVLDGRDVGRDTAKIFVPRLQEKMKTIGVGQLASMSGRYYAMDRDNRWDRVEKAYNAMALGKADQTTEDPLKTIEEAYAKEKFDEEFIPTVITKGGEAVAKIEKGDVCICFNFRPDRSREITHAFVLPDFKDFQREKIEDLLFVTMAEYEGGLPVTVAYPPVVIKNCLAEVVSKANLKQFHVAETEKYAHITFFLNGTIEDPFPGEDRKIVPSPKVTSYAEKPEMSATGVAEETVKAIQSKRYDVIFCNLANADMVGHTGDFNATVKGVEAADKAMAMIVDATLAAGGVMLMTADHGNGEEVLNVSTGKMDKEHSTNPIPFLIIGASLKGQTGPTGDPPGGDLSQLPPVGMLADVAPTMLKILGIPQPEEMTGQALI
ncbi:phosphoglycerate mutase (2,3-diphosphoglycerate-independent) [Candidatus Uhrbacteria bacterium RIFCSPLOWO2_02_FULL_51_9]|uniref:2,3-bisphosphoglycerate-independent phosphoglycerate mutase n=1 Tax=Candidatus Uhrbacteria bacterium RIFCSPLOWO2_02_FULL_51_9 TaxID=1802410 RepID=A0A1F7VEN1_9BACT|nr:MAG: phosphoglycerate mutase (2,3-diphosphoglycerate-independent) [Candidatus Uhrbacteria bacterium RIFCSPLOWO2_02_FULL_51_9]